MRIRKVSQSTPIKAKVVNSHSESEEETYSCDYMNEHSFVVSSTEPTGNNRKKMWIQNGKNLFNSNWDVDNRIAVGESKSVVLNLEPNTIYTFSSNIPLINDTALFFFASGTSTEGLSTSVNGVWEGQSRTFTSDNDGKMIVAYRRTPSAADLDYSSYEYQLEEGSTATTYETFKNYIYLLINDIYKLFK